jgi:phosphodiesterase/alkaline phosphatase D-like protein
MSKMDRRIDKDSPFRQRKTTIPLSRLTRRQFLKVSFAGFAAASLMEYGIVATPDRIARAFQTATMPNGVAAGEITQTSAVLWVHSTALGTVTFEYADADDFGTILGTMTAEVTDGILPVKVAVDGLSPATDYFYRVSDSADNVAMGTFRTAAELGTQNGLRFGVTGDWRGELAPYPSISNVLERELTFFVGMGDTIYSDYPSPDLEKPQCLTLEDYRIKHNEGYAERFEVNYWAAIRSNIAFIPTIDDHEVANDFAGGAAPSYDPRFEGYEGEFVNETELYRNGLQAFREFNPIHDLVWQETNNPLTDGKPNLYRYFTYGSDAAVFVLDNRSYRSAPLEAVTDFNNFMETLTFLTDSFDDSRTMLGMPQLNALIRDLMQAHEDGITWKFVMMPEPIQNLGFAVAQDRFEGYAAERSAILKFIADNEIKNVVFVAADIHGTIVNDITYQVKPLVEQITTDTWEISTGAVAFDAPFAPTVADLADSYNLLTPEQLDFFVNGSDEDKEDFIQGLINAQVDPLSAPLVGLDENDNIDAELLQGKWTATLTYGWTEFDIDAETQQLRVTTYGIDPYTREEIEADPDDILSRTPRVVQEFTVNPK